MDVCGEGLNIQRSHLMQLAKTGGLDHRWAAQRLDGMLGVVDQWATIVEAFDVRRATRQAMHQRVIGQRHWLSGA
jgi:serine/threonine-protein kinase HipA